MCVRIEIKTGFLASNYQLEVVVQGSLAYSYNFCRLVGRIMHCLLIAVHVLQDAQLHLTPFDNEINKVRDYTIARLHKLCLLHPWALVYHKYFLQTRLWTFVIFLVGLRALLHVLILSEQGKPPLFDDITLAHVIGLTH